MPASAGWSGAAYLTQPVSRIWLHLPADGMDCCCRRRCVSQTQSLRSWLLSVRILCYYFICWTLCLAATVLGRPWLWPGCRVHPHLVDATVSTASCVAASSTISLFLRFCRARPSCAAPHGFCVTAIGCVFLGGLCVAQAVLISADVSCVLIGMIKVLFSAVTIARVKFLGMPQV